MLTLCLTVLAAYLIGAIPFGYLIARSRGIDILHQGSGNIGATNVGRLLGRRFGLLVFVLDFLKGALPTATAGWIARGVDLRLPPDSLPVATGLATLLGHLFPVYLRFRGGKGVATGAGVVTVLLPVPALGALLVWLTVVVATRTVSLASLAAAGALLLFRLLTAEPLAEEHVLLTAFCLFAAVLIFVRHRANLRRLVRGEENRLREGPAMTLLARMLHVLAVGLWFGTVVFFTFVVGLSLFGTFQPLAENADRPLWFPVAQPFYRDPQAWGSESAALFKDAPAVRREQGTRVAGAAVGPMFDWYFPVQVACGAVALITAWGWSQADPTRRAHRLRNRVLILAVGAVLFGMAIQSKVSGVSKERNRRVDIVLQSPQPTTEELREATAMVHEFTRWHLVSLFLNLATLGLVTVAMMLTACLPTIAGTLPADPVSKREAVPSPA